jgi:hypothetical protein
MHSDVQEELEEVASATLLRALGATSRYGSAYTHPAWQLASQLASGVSMHRGLGSASSKSGVLTGIRPNTPPRLWEADVSKDSTTSFSIPSFILCMAMLHL